MGQGRCGLRIIGETQFQDRLLFELKCKVRIFFLASILAPIFEREPGFGSVVGGHAAYTDLFRNKPTDAQALPDQPRQQC